MQKKYKVCIIAKGDRNSRAERGVILFFVIFRILKEYTYPLHSLFLSLLLPGMDLQFSATAP